MKTTLRGVYAYVSFTLFIAFIALFILMLTGKSDLLLRILHGYLEWTKQGPILVVLMLFTVISALCSRIFTFGICGSIVAKNESLTSKIFWSALAIFLVIQLVGLYLVRRAV